MPTKEDKPVGKNAILRTPQVQVTITTWNWKKGTKDTVWNLQKTHLLATQWQKTLKNPAGSCTITLAPEYGKHHFYEEFHPLDVIQIYEFGILKWQGYIRRVSFSGYIDEQGKPQRTVIITGETFGAFLINSSVGVNLSIHEETTDLYQASTELANSIQKAADDGLSLQEVISTISTSWFSFLKKITNSSKQSDYLNEYVDFTSGIDSVSSSIVPREIFLFQGDEDSINLWQLIQKVSEMPFNEFFFIEGPRSVWVNNSSISLQSEKTYLIGRPTPFDGSINLQNGAEENRFAKMPTITIPLSHLTRFDLNKSMEEVYSAYIVNPAIIDLSKVELAAIGGYYLDKASLEKYGYRELQKNLYYLRVSKKQAAEKDVNASKITSYADRAAEMLYNWFRKNDLFSSGVLTFMVPSDSKKDPTIGDKVQIEEVDATFYAEAVSHSWTYGSQLRSSVSVTRGLDSYGDPVKLLNRIFKRGRVVT